jgi:hypothetical protein
MITMMEELELDHQRAKDQEEVNEQREEDVVVVEVPVPSKKNPTDKTKEKKKKKNDIQFKLTSFFKKNFFSVFDFGLLLNKGFRETNSD